MRSAGCVVNDIFDREIDPHVERTKSRPLASGRLSLKTAWFMFVLLCIASASLLFYLNPATRYLALAGMLVAMVYPLLKRITYFPQAALGVAFSWGILMASTAVVGKITHASWLLFAVSFFWVFAYDTIYAKMDEPDDSKIGIKSTAVRFRENIRELLGFLYGSAWILLIVLGITAGFGCKYFIATTMVGVVFIVFISIVKDASPPTLQRLFNFNQWAWLMILMGVVLD